MSRNKKIGHFLGRLYLKELYVSVVKFLVSTSFNKFEDRIA
jgi:hypothetical protein